MPKRYEGVIDVCSKNGAGIATKHQTMNPKTWWGYDQLGTYKGDMTGFKVGDRVKLTYREKTGSFWKDLRNSFKPNIIQIGKIESEPQTCDTNGLNGSATPF